MTGNHQKCPSETIHVLKPGRVVGISLWKEIKWLLAMKPIGGGGVLNKSFRYRLSFFACIYCTTSSVLLLLILKPPFYAVS